MGEQKNVFAKISNRISLMFSFVKNRYYFYSIALGLVAISIVVPFLTKLNLGIDMTGGIQIEYTAENGNIDTIVTTVKEKVIAAAQASLSDTEKKIISDTVVYRVSGTNNFIIEAGVAENQAMKDGKSDLPTLEGAKTAFVNAVANELKKIDGSTIIQSRYVNIGASFGAYIKTSGYITLAIAIIAISLYIQYAFRGSIAGMASWPFAIVTGVSLIHDVIIASGFYIITSFFFPEFKIDTFFITAMLTVLGYSINDTIVVMDRIRSNLHEGTARKMAFSAIIDKSIHDTMRRSLFTSLTVIIVLIAMFFFGPGSLKGFTLVLIYGGLIGTYSSICIASPLLVDITKKK